jgi:hypothetical protein
MTDKPGTPAVRTMRAQELVNLVVRGLLRTPGLSRIIGSRLVTLYVAGQSQDAGTPCPSPTWPKVTTSS